MFCVLKSGQNQNRQGTLLQEKADRPRLSIPRFILLYAREKFRSIEMRTVIGRLLRCMKSSMYWGLTIIRIRTVFFTLYWTVLKNWTAILLKASTHFMKKKACLILLL